MFHLPFSSVFPNFCAEVVNAKDFHFKMIPEGIFNYRRKKSNENTLVIFDLKIHE